eukprot:12412868-Karenia_brevis.AAC.1
MQPNKSTNLCISIGLWNVGGRRRMQSAASNTVAKRAKRVGAGEEFLHSLANEDRPDREEVEDDI